MVADIWKKEDEAALKADYELGDREGYDDQIVVEGVVNDTLCFLYDVEGFGPEEHSESFKSIRESSDLLAEGYISHQDGSTIKRTTLSDFNWFYVEEENDEPWFSTAYDATMVIADPESDSPLYDIMMNKDSIVFHGWKLSQSVDPGDVLNANGFDEGELDEVEVIDEKGNYVSTGDSMSSFGTETELYTVSNELFKATRRVLRTVVREERANEWDSNENWGDYDEAVESLRKAVINVDGDAIL